MPDETAIVIVTCKQLLGVFGRPRKPKVLGVGLLG